MFTGLIEELGSVIAAVPTSAGMRLSVMADLIAVDVVKGDSIAVNGVCLTAIEVGTNTFAADVSPETLERSTLGMLKTGSVVNLERAVTPATRLGGHLVQGHVDGRGTFVFARADGEFRTVRIGYPAELGRYLVAKGSVAVEGISLTIAALANDYFDIAVIPKTWEMTNLSTLSPGDPVNLEMDVIAKYVERIMSFTHK
jgi:riboflavin synthase